MGMCVESKSSTLKETCISMPEGTLGRWEPLLVEGRCENIFAEKVYCHTQFTKQVLISQICMDHFWANMCRFLK